MVISKNTFCMKKKRDRNHENDQFCGLLVFLLNLSLNRNKNVVTLTSKVDVACTLKFIVK